MCYTVSWNSVCVWCFFPGFIPYLGSQCHCLHDLLAQPHSAGQDLAVASLLPLVESMNGVQKHVTAENN